MPRRYGRFFDRCTRVCPSPAARHRLQLPPVWVDPCLIELLDQRRRGRLIDGADLRRNDLQQELQLVAPRRLEQTFHGRFLTGARRRIVIRMAEAQHLDDFLARPFAQGAAIAAKLRLESQRTRARKLSRASDPQAGAGRRIERPAADPVVAKNTVARTAVLDLQRRLEAQLLEGAALFERIAFHLLQLLPMIEGEDAALRPVALTIGRPVDPFQLAVVSEVGPAHAAREEEFELIE